MRLPFLPKLAKKNNYSYFLVLILRDEKANAVIFEELNGKIRTIGRHEEYFKDSINNVEIEELLDVLDKTISTAEESLPPNIETQKTILGVKADWTEDNKIKKNHLSKLKQVCDELGLTPIGFLVVPEAISHLLQKQEGAPVSAILAEIGKKSASVSVIKAGKIMETKSSEIHQSPSFTVDALLKNLILSEILPSRIIVFNGEEDFSQEFISHQWSKSLPFLHLPQIVNLPLGFDAKAVLFGAAVQMGFEVLEKDIPQPSISRRKVEESIEAPEVVKEEEAEKIKEENDFGFIANEDIAKNSPPSVKEEVGNIAEITQHPLEQTKTPVINFLSKLSGLITLAQPIFIKIFEGIKKIDIKRFIPKRSTSVGGKKIFIFIIPLILIIIYFLIHIFLTSATVVLSIKPKVINQTESVTFSSTVDKSTDNTIAAKDLSVTQEGVTSTSTTGKKEVGEKAKGTVTVFNISDTTETFPQGTVIISSNQLEFTLLDKVTVASGSGDAISGKTPGKANVNAQASKSGTEYNLPSNTKFSIGNDSSIAAKNDNPFSGGTKKEITVVAKEDVNKLLTELPKKLEQKAMEEFKKTLPSETALLPVFIKNNVTKKNFDKDIGDQSNQLVLTGTVNYQALSYNRNDLSSFAKKIIQKGTSKDLIANDKDIKIDIKNIDKKNGNEVSADLDIKGILLPNINSQDLINKIKGLSIKDVTALLTKIPGVSKVNISIFPNLPFFKKSLPNIFRNIKILTNNNG